MRLPSSKVTTSSPSLTLVPEPSRFVTVTVMPVVAGLSDGTRTPQPEPSRRRVKVGLLICAAPVDVVIWDTGRIAGSAHGCKSHEVSRARTAQPDTMLQLWPMQVVY